MFAENTGGTECIQERFADPVARNPSTAVHRYALLTFSEDCRSLRLMSKPGRVKDSARMPASGKANRPAAEALVWTRERILYEDEWLMVVDKPAGVATEPTLDPGRVSVHSAVMAYLRARDGGEPYLGLQHRLDLETSGVLLFTRNPKANAGVSALFAEKRALKTYQALTVAGPPCPDAWDVANHLGVVGRAGKRARYGAVRSGGDPARTSFRVLGRLPGVLWVEARPHTGRTHQIRVHLAGDGHPILGDVLYGGPLEVVSGATRVRVSRVLLHAAVLEFTHPMTSASLRISSPLPRDLQEALRALGHLWKPRRPLEE